MISIAAPDEVDVYAWLVDPESPLYWGISSKARPREHLWKEPDVHGLLDLPLYSVWLLLDLVPLSTGNGCPSSVYRWGHHLQWRRRGLLLWEWNVRNLIRIEEGISIGILYVPRPSKRYKRRPYSEQQRKQNEAWDTIAKSLCDKCLPRPVFSGDEVCSLCSEKSLYRCTDCGPLVYYCEVCCIQQHSNRCVLHVPEQWINGQFLPVMLSYVHFPLDHSCLTERKENIIIVSMKGVSIIIII